MKLPEGWVLRYDMPPRLPGDLLMVRVHVRLTKVAIYRACGLPNKRVRMAKHPGMDFKPSVPVKVHTRRRRKR